MKYHPGGVLAVILLGSMAASGCGLKGALTLPSKSDEVVIRAPGQTAEGEAAPADGATTTTPPATPTTEPARETPARPRVERLPPPPLPGGNAGSVRGG
jgi:predicted small lipoprotein YifL